MNPHDSVVGRSLQTYGEFAEHEIFLLRHFMNDGDTVADIGANIGTHAVFFSRAVGPHGHVVCVEPQPDVCEILRKNLEANGCANAEAVHAALGRESGNVEIPQLDYTREGNFGAFSFCIEDIGRLLPVSEDNPVSVPLRTLDSLEPAACHLIKIDAEGMEGDILKGASQTIASHRPVLYVENNHRGSSPALLSDLSQLGYRAYWHVISYYRPDNHAAVPDNIFEAPLELNVLCLPNEVPEKVSSLPIVTQVDEWLPDAIADGAYNVADLLEVAESFAAGS